MPRRTRTLSQSKIYHVMIRGNERKNIFLDEEDKTRFIDTLRRLAKQTSKTVVQLNQKKFCFYAYCVMSNHVHLLINEGEDTISRIMKRIQTSYAYYFNKKYGRIGHLFQDRFRSEAIESEDYLYSVVRYIHNNPVKAGMVNHASQYPFSSCQQYLWDDPAKIFVERDEVLEMFHDIDSSVIEDYDGFIDMEDGDEEEKLLQSEQEVRAYIDCLLTDNAIKLAQLRDKQYSSLRVGLIRYLRKKSKLSIRQIAEILRVSRGVVQRASVS